MTAADPILDALAQTERRLCEGMKDSFRELKLDFKRYLDCRFDALCQRLDTLADRLREIREHLPPE
jgi:hypothetical protein